MKKRKVESFAVVAPASKRKRPDVAVRKQQGKYHGRHVVKCTLAPFSRYKVVWSFTPVQNEMLHEQ